MTSIDDLLNIPEAPLKEALDPAIYVEPRDRDVMDEDHRQMALVSAIKRDAPHIIIHATPNGGRQSDWARVRGHRMGVYTGFPDLSLDWREDSATIEMKDGTGSPSQDQIQCLNRLHSLGRHVAICRTKDGALRWLKSIGAPL